MTKHKSSGLIRRAIARSASRLARPSRAFLVSTLLVVLGATVAAQQPTLDVSELLGLVSLRVEHYYQRAHRIICTETVHVQSTDPTWTAHDYGRTLVYDLRVEWDRSAEHDGAAEPSVFRQLRTVDGRPPKATEEPGCMDPPAASTDTLAMLLALHRREYFFTLAGSTTIDRRAALMIDYRARRAGPVDLKVTDRCVSVDLPGHFRGRVWVDAKTNEVLRVDEQLDGKYDVRVPAEHPRFGVIPEMTVERYDTRTNYRAVAFHDPDETLMLPASITTTQVFRNTGVPRLLVTRTYSDYRRYTTDSRIVKPGAK